MRTKLILLLLLPVVGLAQTAKTRSSLYTEIDSLFASGQQITAAQLRTGLKDVVASAQNIQSDGTAVVTSGSYSDPTWLTLSKSKVGLANVDNTSDVNKPVSTAQAAANAVVASNAAADATSKANAAQAASQPLATVLTNTTAAFTSAQEAKLAGIASGAQTGTVTSASVTTANGVSASVATATTTPAFTFTLGAITPSTVNGVTFSGSATPTLAVTGTSAISGTNTGDQTTVSGNAGSATVLQTARTINGVSFDGSANITVAAAGSTLSDTVTVAKGGTGATTLAANNVLLGNGTSALQAVAPSTSGNVLTSNGTTWTSAPPSGSGGDVTAASAFGADNRLIRSDGTGKGVQASGVTLDDSDNLTGINSLTVSTFTFSSLSGVIPAANGGAGTVSGVMKANGSGTVSAASAGTDYLAPSGSGASLTGITQSQVSGLTTTSAPTFSNVQITPSTLTYAATTTIDFSNDGLKTVTLSGNITFATSNLAAGRSVTVRIIGDGSSRTLTFPGTWTFVGAAAPASLAASKTAILTLTSFSTTDANVVAAYAAAP
jgi:hypothetical protein